jgi:hypothetical protein
MFRYVNELVEIVHYFPNSTVGIFDALKKGSLAELSPNAELENRRFENAARWVFGDRWQKNGFYLTHQSLADGNARIMDDEHLKHLLHAYRPWTN